MRSKGAGPLLACFGKRLKLTVVMASQLCEYIKNHRTVTSNGRDVRRVSSISVTSLPETVRQRIRGGQSWGADHDLLC